MLLLKLKTIDKCLFSAHIKGRSQCYASLHCDDYVHNKKVEHVQLYIWMEAICGRVFVTVENKQQIMLNNVETQHKHMYSLYIQFGTCSLCNIVFPTSMSRPAFPAS